VAGWLAGRVLRIRRRVTRENLARAFPERSRAWRARVARESYRHLGRAAATTFRLSHLTPAEILALSRVEGRELLAEPVARGDGAILVTGHIGNWEVGGGALACRGLPLDVVVRPQNNPLFDRALVQARRRLGMNVVSRGDSVHVLLRLLRKGRVVVLLADQNAHADGLMVDFFGEPASTARGAALLSLRSGAPLVLGVALHHPAAPVPHHLVLEQVSISPSGVPARDVEALTRAHVAALERWVRRYPGQYLWQHRRWSRA
jgi:KDO2-lipid IV(A) lauroyltransferase